jgi:DNA/RNA endonuclease G (NUC1)
MKKHLLILLLTLTTLTGWSQTLRDSVQVNNEYFKIVYSEVLEQPKKVEYTVLCPNGTASRAGMEFFTVKGLKTSDNHDYVANEWDKGHMVPAASFNCTKEMLHTTFSYANSALQQQSLNRGPWKMLEIQERKLALNNTVSVYIRIEFNGKINRLPTGAAIPTGFYKELRYGTKKECYFFPNVKPANSDYTQFKCNCR